MKFAKVIFIIVMIVIFATAMMGSAFRNAFIGSVAVYDATNRLYKVYDGEIENLMYSDGYARFTFEGHTYTYINYFIEIIR